MSGIVCAIRGGPDSKPTIDKTLELAAEANLPVYFLYVVNLDYFTHSTRSRVHTVEKELHQMGEFILLTAQSQAEAKGITAEGLVRQGNVLDEIICLCQEIKANYVILGYPKQQKEINVFTDERLDEFRQRIEDESGAKIVLAEI